MHVFLMNLVLYKVNPLFCPFLLFVHVNNKYLYFLLRIVARQERSNDVSW